MIITKCIDCKVKYICFSKLGIQETSNFAKPSTQCAELQELFECWLDAYFLKKGTIK